MSQPYQQDPFTAFIAARDGARVPAACDSCDAYAVIRAHVAGHPGVHSVTVYHDPGCPMPAAQPARKEGDPS